MTNPRSTKVKGHHRLRIAVDTAITLCAEHAVDRHLQEDFPVASWPFPRPSRARVLYVSRARVAVCGGVRIYDASRRPWKDTTV